MRKDPINGVVWISFDKKIPTGSKDNFQNPVRWLDLTIMPGIESYPTNPTITYTPSHFKYISSMFISYGFGILVTYLVAVCFYHQPATNTSSQTSSQNHTVILPNNPGQQNTVNYPTVNSSSVQQKISVTNNPSINTSSSQSAVSTTNKLNVPSISVQQASSTKAVQGGASTNSSLSTNHQESSNSQVSAPYSNNQVGIPIPTVAPSKTNITLNENNQTISNSNSSTKTNVIHPKIVIKPKTVISEPPPQAHDTQQSKQTVPKRKIQMGY